MTAERVSGYRPTPTSPCLRFLEGMDVDEWALAVVGPGAEGFVDSSMDCMPCVSVK